MAKFSYISNPCPNCGEESKSIYHEVVFPQGNVSWVKCKNDGLIYQNPRLDNKSIFSLFNSCDYIEGGTSDTSLGYYGYFEGEKSRLAMYEMKIKKIEKLLNPGSIRKCNTKGKKKSLNIFEIGCATGSFLKVCLDHGHKAWGIDASSALAGFGKKNYSLDITVGLFEDANISESPFDVVAIFGSLSSLYNPVKVFKKIRSYLKPGGIVVFNTPVLDGWTAKLLGKKLWMFRPSGQVLFTKKTVLGLLKETGFGLVEAKLDIQAVSIDKLALVSNLSILGRVFDSIRKYYVIVPVPSVIQVIATVKG